MQNLFYDCYALDERCYTLYGLSEDILMEHAAMGMANYIKQRYGGEKKICILCGPGNNGADGIALARQLHGLFDVFISLPYGAKSMMAKLQLDRFERVGGVVGELMPCEIIVDALFGAGLKKELDSTSKALINKANSMDCAKIACDIPTGVDAKGGVVDTAFKADITFTMGALKTALFLDEAIDYVGKPVVVDLGISRRLYEKESFIKLLEKKDFTPPIRTSLSSHKGNFGHLNVLAGQKQGAAILSSLAAMRFGSGLVTVVCNEAIEVPYELMKDTHVTPSCDAIAIGMGLGSEFHDSFLESEVLAKDCPMVLDADGLSNGVLLKALEQKDRDLVLTPHPKEFCKLLASFGVECDVADLQKDRIGYVKEFTKRYNHTLILKGACTIIAKQNDIYINPYACSALSQAGSGDVLSGVVASLLGQGYSGLEAAINGSLALSFAAQSYEGTNYSMSAKDLLVLLKTLGKGN